MGEFLAIALAIIEAALPIIEAVGVAIEIKKEIDEIGNVVTEVTQMIDTDGDGTYDSQSPLITIDMPIPDLSGGFSFCNNADGEFGIGFPQYQLIDGSDIASYIDVDDAPFNLPILSGNNNGYVLDLDNDRDIDDVLVPLGYDFTGDSIPDFGWVVDVDDNNLPDASADLPFYPVGSEEFEQYSAQVLDDVELSIMEKPLDDYTVTEGLLFIGFIVLSFSFIHKIFRRKRVL